MKARVLFELAIAALSALLIAPPTQSHVKTPNAVDSHVSQRSTTLNEARYVRIGGIDQWIQISGTDAANPMLLWLNGVLNTHRTCYIAIGQLHVLGPDGIPAQLRRRAIVGSTELLVNPASYPGE